MFLFHHNATAFLGTHANSKLNIRFKVKPESPGPKLLTDRCIHSR